jgi:hypothetical protein
VVGVVLAHAFLVALLELDVRLAEAVRHPAETHRRDRVLDSGSPRGAVLAGEASTVDFGQYTDLVEHRRGRRHQRLTDVRTREQLGLEDRHRQPSPRAVRRGSRPGRTTTDDPDIEIHLRHATLDPNWSKQLILV